MACSVWLDNSTSFTLVFRRNNSLFNGTSFVTCACCCWVVALTSYRLSVAVRGVWQLAERHRRVVTQFSSLLSLLITTIQTLIRLFLDVANLKGFLVVLLIEYQFILMHLEEVLVFNISPIVKIPWFDFRTVRIGIKLNFFQLNRIIQFLPVLNCSPDNSRVPPSVEKSICGEQSRKNIDKWIEIPPFWDLNAQIAVVCEQNQVDEPMCSEIA